MNSLELNGCLGADLCLLDKPLRPSRLLLFVSSRRYFLFSGIIEYCDFCMPSVILSMFSWTLFIQYWPSAEKLACKTSSFPAGPCASQSTWFVLWSPSGAGAKITRSWCKMMNSMWKAAFHYLRIGSCSRAVSFLPIWAATWANSCNFCCTGSVPSAQRYVGGGYVYEIRL